MKFETLSSEVAWGQPKAGLPIAERLLRPLPEFDLLELLLQRRLSHCQPLPTKSNGRHVVHSGW
jgi:hypothetical protein